MSVETLVAMRDQISAALAGKAAILKKELAALGGGVTESGRGPMPGRKGMKLGKVPPKYRGSKGETWAGRGAMPVWMRDAIKGGKKQDDFLIDKSTMPARKAKKGKRGRPRKA